MTILNPVSRFFFFLLWAQFSNAQMQLRDFYICLIPLGRLEYLSELEQQLLQTDQLKAKRYPAAHLELTKESNSEVLGSTGALSYARLGINQVIYDRSVNNEINLAEARTETVRNLASENEIIQIKNAVETVTKYYHLKHKLKITEQKIERLTSLISVLRDLVRAKSTDGLLLTLSEGDLSLLNIRFAELSLQIQKIQKSFFISEKLRKLIVDDTVYKLALKVADEGSYRKQADQSLFRSLESKKKEIELRNRTLAELLTPKINLAVDYYSYLEHSSSIGRSNDLVFSVSLTIPFSDLYTQQTQKSSHFKSLQLTQSSIERLRFETSAIDSYSIERTKQISQTIASLNAIKVNLKKAKDVISKKLLINRASYSDYVQVDDRFDEVEEQLVMNQLERAKVFIFNQVEGLFSSESLHTKLTCDL